jgi:hypothetical protein
MRQILSAIPLLLSACAPAPQPPAQPPVAQTPAVAAPEPLSADAQAALATVQRLFDAMRTRDTGVMRTLFDPSARLYGVRMRRDSTVVVQAISANDFIGAVARGDGSPGGGPAWNERLFNPEVRVSGPLATVWAEYDFHAGTTFSHCGVDAVQLLKVGAAWRIVAVSDTFVRVGCPSRPQ